jgi:hypothetical protein
MRALVPWRAVPDLRALHLRPLTAFALILTLCLVSAAVASATSGSAYAATAATAAAKITTAKRCYQVGQAVTVTGAGFMASSEYDVAVDGIDFGQSVTNASGGFKTAFKPGGLAAGQAQIVDRLDASDGVSDPAVNFTVTRNTGALFGAGTGSSAERKVPFEVWDFAPTGPAAKVYLHYVNEQAVSPKTVALGTTTGQCGYLRTKPQQLFPFKPTAGVWLLQFDTDAKFALHPKGRVARLYVEIG